MKYVDVFGKYYSFGKLPQDNRYYPLKKDNYELVKKLYFDDKVELQTFPIRATVQTTEFCNLNCIMCQIHSQKPKRKLQSMKKSDFDMVVKHLFPYLVEIHPTNIGEPLMSEWFEYFCDKVLEYGILFDITTNGTLLNEKILHKILPNLLDIKISFDGIKKDTFERIREGADFDSVSGNIDILLKSRKEEKSQGTITLQMTLFNFNYKELPEIIRFAHDKGIDRVKAYHVDSHSCEINELSLINNLEQFEETRISAIELAEKLNIALEVSEPCGNTEAHRQKCRLPWSECWIDVDGKVFPCHSHKNISLGDIHFKDFQSVWNSDYTQKLRKSLMDSGIETICKNCGMNFIKYDENQSVPYDKAGYLHNSDKEADCVKWSSRNKQFECGRRYE